MSDGRGNYDNHVILYVKNVCGVFQRQFELGGRDNIMFHLEQNERISEAISLSTTTTLFIGCCEEVRKKVMSLFDNRVV